jgi:hypothetical protein
MLLSAGGFAEFHAETHAFSVLAPRFRNLATPPLRRRMMEEWVATKHFERSGLERETLIKRVVERCHNTGDFLTLFMEDIAAAQDVDRWADCTPTHVLYMPQIKREIPGALFVHIIRDGRDVALSYSRLGWVKPLPGDRSAGLQVAALDWRWNVRRGREVGRRLGSAYMEVQFEQLLAAPQTTLDGLARFIDHPLDYARIRSAGLGSVSKPNTSFGSEKGDGFNPVGRWQKALTPENARALEFLLEDTLTDLGYSVGTQPVSGLEAARLRARRSAYDVFFSAKHWARVHTPLGRLTNTDTLRNW